MSHGNVINVSSLSQLNGELTKAKDKLVVIDFFAKWCGPCKNIAPFFVQLSLNNSDVVFIKVDTDEAKDIVQKFSISAMPTFVFLIKGNEVDRLKGANQDALVQCITKHRVPVSAMVGTSHKLGDDDDDVMMVSKPQATTDDTAEREFALSMLVDMGFPRDRILAAFTATGRCDVEAAVDWMNDHMDDEPIDEAKSEKENVIMSETDQAVSTDGKVVHSALCDNCRKQIIGIRYHCTVCYDTDFCESCVKGHDQAHLMDQVTENTILKQTPQQLANKMKQLEERAAEIRRQKEEEAEKESRQREIRRRKMGQEAEEAKEERTARMLRMHDEKMKKEREEEKQERVRVLELIKHDKEERKLKQEQELGLLTEPQATKPANPVKLVCPESVKTATIQFRFPCMTSERTTFSTDDCVATMFDYVRTHQPEKTKAITTSKTGMWKLVIPFPRKIITAKDNHLTLRELGLYNDNLIVLYE